MEWPNPCSSDCHDCHDLQISSDLNRNGVLTVRRPTQHFEHLRGASEHECFEPFGQASSMSESEPLKCISLPKATTMTFGVHVDLGFSLFGLFFKHIV